MTEGNIKRYTMAEIRAMLDAGQYFPTASDAPEFELDDEFWKNAKPVSPGKTVVQLELDRSTVEAFEGQNPDYKAGMVKVLEDYAAKKAS